MFACHLVSSGSSGVSRHESQYSPCFEVGATVADLCDCTKGVCTCHIGVDIGRAGGEQIEGSLDAVANGKDERVAE